MSLAQQHDYEPLNGVEEGDGPLLHKSSKGWLSKKSLVIAGVCLGTVMALCVAGVLIHRAATAKPSSSLATSTMWANGQCSVSDNDRKDCGFIGIDQGGCEQKGCCWAPTSQDHPWCFQPGSGGSQGSCSVPDNQKSDCGYSGITQDGCQQKGCCWAEAGAFSNTPWCYHKSGGDDGHHDGGSSCFKVSSKDLSQAPFSSSEISTMKQYFLNNINVEGSGAIAASPDHNTPGGSYYWHWKRDGALTMNALQHISGSLSEFSSLMQAYARFVVKTYEHTDNLVDVRIEPKYSIPDGTPYNGGWCRPQIDGPGLEAIALIEYANALKQAGDSSFISEYLWTSGSRNGGIIKTDLDFLVQHWGDDGCDLWEEVHSNDFFWNRMAYYKAFTLGAQFADSMGDSGRANTYRSTASNIYNTLSNHWTGEYIYESQNRMQDGAVIIAFNDNYVDGDSKFSPVSEYVSGTVRNYIDKFCSIYNINQQDTNNGIAGVLIGRYPGDSYAGGNPWQLLTAGLAELFYRAATEVRKSGLPSGKALENWQAVLGGSFSSASDMADKLAKGGDGIMERLYVHVKDGGFHVAEQIDKNNGQQTSAKDLTWSYAGLLKAMKAREQYMSSRN